MDAFFTSALTVAVAEIGDKTQLLSLVLAARFRNKWAIIAGILVATLVNHGISAWLGHYIGGFFSSDIGHWVVGISFLLLAIWLLFPDKDEAVANRFDHYGAFVVSCLLFFLAEVGDKTQIATVLLGAQYGSVLLVTLGTTLGMLVANIPVVLAGGYVLQFIPMTLMRIISAAVFALIGVLQILAVG